MKKGILATVCVVALLFLGATLASAGNITWTILTSTSVTGHGPGPDQVIGTGDDTTDGSQAGKCNFTTDTGCAASGTPTIGTFSYTYLDFQMTMSCASGDNRGMSCTTNAECGAPCIPCGDETYSYFYKKPGATKGVGTFVIENCSDGITYNKMNIGTSEAVTGSGGGCLTLSAARDDDTGPDCGVGTFSSVVDLELWVDALGSCDLDAGQIPDINLDGRVYDASAAPPAGVCGYNTAGIQTLLNAAGNTGYVMVACDAQPLPTGLMSTCISGAPFISKIVSKTTADASDCPDCSSSGCMAGTAEGVE